MGSVTDLQERQIKLILMFKFDHRGVSKKALLLYKFVFTGALKNYFYCISLFVWEHRRRIFTV